ncbi:MAG: hypothetical protein IKO51_08160 [Clostridia bacterium]|nr:hypothetical protein [Clostridia bacterium]
MRLTESEKKKIEAAAAKCGLVPGVKRYTMFGLPVTVLSGIIIVTLKKMLYMNHNKSNGGNMKRVCCIILITAFCFIAISGCVSKNAVILSQNSFFDRMIIHDGKVYMLCSLEFVNKSDDEQIIDVTAESMEDVKNGLLKDSSLKLYIFSATVEVNEENIEQLLEPAEHISINGHETVRYYACFVGEHGGGMQKQDRELPDKITITDRSK